MSDQNAPYPGAAQQPQAPERTPAGMPQQQRFIEQATFAQPLEVAPGSPQQGLGPLTLREWIVAGAGALMLLLSFFSITPAGYLPVWGLGLLWVGAIGFPFTAAVLVVLRRFVPSFRNVGALSIDQFASVGFSVAAYLWLVIVVSYSGYPGVGVVAWLTFLVALAGVFFTVFARFVPPFSHDFTAREQTAAHAVARPVRPIARAPRPEPQPQAQWGQPGADGSSPHVPQATAPQSYGPHAGAEPWAQPAPQAAYAAPPYAQQSPAPQSEPAAHDPFAAPAEQVPWFEQPAPAAPGYGQPQPDPAAHDAQPQTHVHDVAAPDAAPAAAEQQPAEQMPAETAPDQPTADETPLARGGDENAADEPFAAPAADAAPADPQPEEAPQQQPAPAPQQEQPAPAPQPEQSAPAPQPEQSAPAPQQPFWALVPVERDVHDEHGRPSFRIGPTAWALVLEDRGAYFVVRHDDGRIGYLHDTSGVTRG